jgi:hypothetical protein
MAFFPFSGWKESFFGDLHGQGWDAVEFFTQKSGDRTLAEGMVADLLNPREPEGEATHGT